MVKRVLIIGGYGNFGSYITRKLARENLQIIIAGRSEKKCKSFIRRIRKAKNFVEYEVFDITKEIPLSRINPDVVIHTSGPFQEQSYDVAMACIRRGVHYIDLADGREFVLGIESLSDLAAAAGVAVISGASSVPCLSSAIFDRYSQQFAVVDELDYGITTAQRTKRGLATTRSIMGYVGKPFETTLSGKRQNIFGWQDLHFHTYPEIGSRPLSNCDIPDLDIFPARYPTLKTIRFSAGVELKLMHIGLWLLSWLVRFKWVRSLEPSSEFLLNMSDNFDWMGSDKSAFHMKLTGRDAHGEKLEKLIHIVAKEGHGVRIPCVPAVYLAKRLAFGEKVVPGAYSSAGLIALDEYLKELEGLNVTLMDQ